MKEEISSCVYKICGKTPSSEEQAVKFLEEFLQKKGYSDLQLELLPLIEICLYYTDMNSIVVLNNKFKGYFDITGKINPVIKNYFDIKNNIKDFNQVESLQVVLDSINTISTVKVTTGLSIQLNKSALFNWSFLYYYENKIFGKVSFIRKQDDIIKNKLIKLFSEQEFTINRESIKEDIVFEHLIEILKKFVNNGKKS